MRPLILSFALLAPACIQASAATTTYNIAFTAAGTAPASGSYTLTFDPSQQYDSVSTGLTVNAFNDGFAAVSNIGFSSATTSWRLGAYQVGCMA